MHSVFGHCPAFFEAVSGNTKKKNVYPANFFKSYCRKPYIRKAFCAHCQWIMEGIKIFNKKKYNWIDTISLTA